MSSFSLELLTFRLVQTLNGKSRHLLRFPVKKREFFTVELKNLYGRAKQISRQVRQRVDVGLDHLKVSALALQANSPIQGGLKSIAFTAGDCKF